MLRTLGPLSVAAVALAAVFVGCSSPVGPVTPHFGGSATSTPVPTATVTFTITPGTSTAASRRGRKPAYLSPGTASVSILPVVTGQSNAQPTVIDLGAGVSGCSGSGATLSCTGTVTAPIGETSFNVTTYGGPNASGGVLSVGTITVDVQPSSSATTISNATSLTLEGVPARLGLSVTPQTIAIGTASTLTAVVTAYDASGAIIIGPGAYTTGVDIETIAPIDASNNNNVLTAPPAYAGSTVPGCTYPTNPNVTTCQPDGSVQGPVPGGVQLSYAGEFVPGSSLLLAAESPGLNIPTVPIVLLTPGPNSCSGSPIKVCPGEVTFANSLSPDVTVSASESGVSTFAANAVACDGANVASIDGQQSSNGTSFVIAPGVNPGTCSIMITDANQNETNLSVTLLAGEPTPSPSPSATPTPVATPTPTAGPITISPNATVEFTSSTAPPQTITASQSGFSSFTIDQSQCTGIASVSPSSGTTFTITPVASLTQGGKCTLVVSNSSGQSSNVYVLVDGTSIIINTRR